jgi:hypothetical protein
LLKRPASGIFLFHSSLLFPSAHAAWLKPRGAHPTGAPRSLASPVQSHERTKKKGGRAPTGASSYRPHRLGCGSAPCARRARLSALHRDIRCGFDPAAQPQAAFP